MLAVSGAVESTQFGEAITNSSKIAQESLDDIRAASGVGNSFRNSCTRSRAVGSSRFWYIDQLASDADHADPATADRQQPADEEPQVPPPSVPA